MADLWLPGATRKPTNNGGTMDGTGGARAVHHITWDRNASATAPADLVPYENLAAYFGGGGAGNAPHILADPFTGRFTQFIPADRSARALVNATGGVQTNRHGTACLQIEWLFFPYCRVDGKVYAELKDAPGKGLPEIMAWLRSWGVPDVWPMGTPDWSGHRDPAVWQERSGHYGHSQVPENDHTDPGPIWNLFQATTAPADRRRLDEEVR
jgi:hypothetical protein